MFARRRDPVELHARLTAWLRDRHPHAERVDVAPPRKPSAGVSNETLLLDVGVREGGRDRTERLVVRLMPAGSPVFPEYDLARQVRVLECVGRSDVPVPRVRWFERDESLVGAPFYVMDAIAGDIPSEIPPYHAFGHTLALSPERRARMWWSGIETLARIHALPWERLGLGFLGVPPPGTGPIDRQLDEYERFLAWARGDTPAPILEAALAWLRGHRYAPRRVTLCWGDSRLPNMIFRDEETVGVLDWEMAFLGDPEADLAWWLFLDWSQGEGYGIPRLEGLPGREETVRRYEELTGHPVEHLDYQEVMAALRYGVITLRVARLIREANLPVGAEDMETNNPCTQRLAALLGLPAPGRAGRTLTRVDEITARVQFHLTGPGGRDWYVVASRGAGTRHPGTVDAPDVTVTAAADDWERIQRGELDRAQAFLGGKLAVTGDVTLLLQLEDMLSRLGE